MENKSFETTEPTLVGMSYRSSDGSWNTIKVGEEGKILKWVDPIEPVDHWKHFRENWKWTSFYNKDMSRREEPVEITLKDMETDHILRCLLYPITNNYTPNTNNMAVFLTELLYRNEDGKF